MDKRDYFGDFGGKYVAEVLRPALEALDTAFDEAILDPAFTSDLEQIQKTYIGRPTPLYFAQNATEALGGAKIFIKMEGLAHTGAHKINNALGQALLAKRMGKTRIIAETGAGQHGLATAAVCAKLRLPCRVYMGEVDVRRQRPNVLWMEQFGAEVVPVKTGSRTLKDAVNEAMRDWCASSSNTHYLLGSALGPAPFPRMVKYFQSVIGREVKNQLSEYRVSPDYIVACVGGGSNSIGIFSEFLDDQSVQLVGVEAGGRGDGIGNNAVRMSGQARPGIVQGYKSYFLQDEDGQVQETHSISAGLDYPGIGPELAYYGKTGRIAFTSARDDEAIEGLKFFAKNEGIIFALESSHAASWVIKNAGKLSKDKVIVLNMSGRGDKDIFITAKALAPQPWKEFLRKEASE